jgi:hypothetical protein
VFSEVIYLNYITVLLHVVIEGTHFSQCLVNVVSSQFRPLGDLY